MTSLNVLKGVTVRVLLATRIQDKESGTKFLRMLHHVAPTYAPQRYNDREPINRSFTISDLEHVLECWGRSFLWRQGRSILGGAYTGFKGAHDVFSLRMPVGAFKADVILELLRVLDETFGVDFASVQIWSAADMADLSHYKVCIAPLSTLTTHDLRNGLPELSWAVVFGRPYVELFGAERLLSAPAAQVTRLSTAIYVQLTADINAIAQQWMMFQRIREAVKRHLNNDAFRAVEPTKYQTPAFRIDHPDEHRGRA